MVSTTSTEEKRKLRKAARKARRVKLREQLKNPDFAKTYFKAKSDRSVSKVSSFKKGKTAA